MPRPFPDFNDPDFDPSDLGSVGSRFDMGDHPSSRRSEIPPNRSSNKSHPENNHRQIPKPDKPTKPQTNNEDRGEKVIMTEPGFQKSVRHRAITLEEWSILFEITKYIGYGVAIADGIFSFWALKVSLDNTYMAAILALIICVYLFILGALISLRGIDEYLSMDKDQNQRVTRGEFFWWCVRIFSVSIVAAVDVSTNYFGISEITARHLLPAELVPGWGVSLLLSCLLMTGAHLIIGGSDAVMDKIGDSYSEADIKRGVTEANKDFASGARSEIISKANQEGRNFGKGYKLHPRVGRGR